MLEGRFGNTSGAPYIEARVSFPRLRLRGLVSFLVDTGADGTVLMPADSNKLGIDHKSLRNPTTSEGIGGAAQGFNEEAVLSFSDRRYVYSYLLNVEISGPTRYNHRFPSLLGRDILKQWRLVMDADRKQITFTPRTWDLRQKI
jgi:predicted aspartyl protease